MNEIALVGFNNRSLISDQVLGLRVRSLRDFSGVPKGTEGVIDEVYNLGGHFGFMVAWDFPGRPLPKDYRVFDGRPSFASGILRDGFSPDETLMLEVIA